MMTERQAGEARKMSMGLMLAAELEGAVIHQVWSSDDGGILDVETGAGQMLSLLISQDEEANGPGYILELRRRPMSEVHCGFCHQKGHGRGRCPQAQEPAVEELARAAVADVDQAVDSFHDPEGYECFECGECFDGEPAYTVPPSHGSADGLTLAWCPECAKEKIQEDEQLAADQEAGEAAEMAHPDNVRERRELSGLD